MDNNLMQTSVDQANKIAGTTQFLNEADVKVVSRERACDVPQGLLSATRVGYDQGLQEFLGKPVRIGTGDWALQAAGDILLNVTIPETPLAEEVYKWKVQGFLGFKGKAVLKLQVNGNKFQAGRLLMVFVPQGQITDTYPGMRVRSLTAATQLPRVELDLSTDTEVVLEIPYISPTPFYNLSDHSGPHGRVYVLVYSPLATGLGSATAGYTLWCHFENVELVAPASFAQMDDVRPKRRANPTESELRSGGEKPLSGGLRTLSKAASSFSKIPVLSAVAGTASWVLDCAAGVASVFGYSKPTSEGFVTKVQPNFQFHMQNHNGSDNLPNMGVDGSNKLQILPGFAGTDVDEMCLSHLVQIPAYITSFTWAMTDASDTNLIATPVHPNAGTTSTVVNLWSTLDCPPIAYFSNFFQYWRGSIVITLKVIKSQLHSGRLMFVFNPYGVGVSTVAEGAYLFREVIDIRETSEFRFVIPYVATTQYRKTNGFSTTTTDSTGVWNVYVLNELVGPDTVSSSIKILVEMAAGPDFELALPKPHGAMPIIKSGWSAQMADVAPSKIAAVADSQRPDRNQEVVAVGSAAIVPPSLEPSMYCIGEKVNSILQLMKRFTLMQYFNSASATYSAVDMRPFAVGYAYTADAVALITRPTGDYYSMFAPCFAYGRGSVRIMAIDPPGVSQVKDAGYVSIYPSTSTTAIQDSASVFSKVGACVNTQPAFGTTMPSGANIPPYQPLHTRLLRPSTTLTDEPVDIYSSPIRLSIQTTTSGSAGKTSLFRAAGDDLTFGYFLGTPLVTTSVVY